ncbi:MAG: peptidoglycan-binding protein [Rhodospirillaceae bacterium]|nr:peptidoglycan-binding protein [Rhodospirillaceae bacterium]MBT5665902.1 peptidoglycan-binding protein [Rhodospirillaceae bacterium]MBT5811844.1 peptidoglycan-binding protein [Rhodospirillaceae bacterium]MBT7944467.1 peptidoglycan-binding protein [Alphaproteobacteria bacterium]
MTTNPFRLKKTIGDSYTMDLDDSLNTKKALADLGHLKIPDYGLTPYPDRAMVDGVKSFQKDHGLKIDGVMKKDGPTINRLNRALSAEQLKAANNNAGGPSQGGKPVQVAGGPLTPFLPLAAQTAARGLSAAIGAYKAATTAQKILEQQNKRKINKSAPKAANDPYARSEIPEPPRQIPSLTPPNMDELSKGGKTEYPGTPVDRPQLDGTPINEQLKNKPYIFAPLKEEMRKLLGGVMENRRGDKFTQRGHDLIVGVMWNKVMEAYDDAVRNRVEHFRGGLTAKDGEYKIEEHVKKENAGMKDSSFADLSFSDEDNQSVLRVNTGRTLKDGKTPIADERRQLLKLRHNGELENVAGTIPKLRRGMDEAEYIERVTPLLKDLVERWIGPPLP